MNSSAKVTSKGQVTIPKHIRDRTGIGPGTTVTFDDRGDEVVMRRLVGGVGGGVDDPDFEAYLDRVTGTLDLGMSTDEFMQLLRGE